MASVGDVDTRPQAVSHGLKPGAGFLLGGRACPGPSTEKCHRKAQAAGSSISQYGI